MTGKAEENKNSKQGIHDLIEKAFAVASLHPMYRNAKGSINQRIVPILDIAFCMIKNQKFPFRGKS